MIDLIPLVFCGTTVTTLIATGAFIQRATDNSKDIAELKKKFEKLETVNVEMATLNLRILNLETQFTEYKHDVRIGFDSLKETLKDFSHKTISPYS